jgi:hypothetical protein
MIELQKVSRFTLVAALASVTTLKRNQEMKSWFEKKEVEFKLAANSG